MSMDLAFWKYEHPISLSHQQVYEQLCDGAEVDGLAALPCQQIRQSVSRQFAAWESPDPYNYEQPDGQGAFSIFMCRQGTIFHCYGMYPNDLNALIDIMLSFGCPLYDPQIGERFDSDMSAE